MSSSSIISQAKVCILGDRGTGKSSLISSLSEISKESGARAAQESDDVIFNNLVIPASDLQGTKSDVHLKIWEYSSHLSKEETELVLRGALFCIITFDLRNPDSANSAFNNWLALKETFMMESFLFVVGTHVDLITSRRVEAAEVCKACAQKDAIYTEVSGLDGTNMSMLWRLIVQRINFVLGVREEMYRQAVGGIGAGGDSDDEEGEFAERQAAETKQRYDKLFGNESSALLDTAFLEPEIIGDSVGSILSSALGTDFWPGYQAEQENLKKIGATICDHVRELALDPSSAPTTPLEFVLQSVPPLSAAQAEGRTLPMPDNDELQKAFEIMGFQLPPSLLQQQGSTADQSSISTAAASATKRPPQPPTAASGAKPEAGAPIRLKIALPGGSSADIQIYPGYHVGRQVESFLVQHGLEDDDEARHKLTRAAEQIAAKHFK
jgi:hypothetical protein